MKAAFAAILTSMWLVVLGVGIANADSHSQRCPASVTLCTESNPTGAEPEPEYDGPTIRAEDPDNPPISCQQMCIDTSTIILHPTRRAEILRECIHTYCK